jgi:hypothetical protein
MAPASFPISERAKSQFRTNVTITVEFTDMSHGTEYLDVVSRTDALAVVPGASPAGPSPARIGLGQLTITSIPEVTNL